MITTIVLLVIGLISFCIALFSLAYFLGKKRGIDEGLDIAYTASIDMFVRFLNSNDGKNVMRHYVFVHELPYLVEQVGTEDAKTTALRIVEDYNQLAEDTAVKEIILEAEDILENAGKEH